MSRIMVVEAPSPAREERIERLRGAGHEPVPADVESAPGLLSRGGPLVVLTDPPVPEALRAAADASGSPLVPAGDDVLHAVDSVECLPAVLARFREQLGPAFGDFARLFLDESLARAATLRTAAGQRDAHRLGREAHTLKPTCALLGAARLADRLAGLERASRDGWSDGLVGRMDAALDDLERLRRRLAEDPHVAA